MKKKYIVSGYLTITVTKVIEADDEAAARAFAQHLAPPALCHQCASAGEHDADAWQLDGFDDPPDDVIQHVQIKAKP